MSSGSFSRGLYATDEGLLAPIKVQPETLALSVGGGANAFATGAATPGLPSALISRSKKSIGIHPRSVTVRFGGNAPEGYNNNTTHTIPVMTLTRYSAISINGAGTYLGAACTVVSKSPERVV